MWQEALDQFIKDTSNSAVSRMLGFSGRTPSSLSKEPTLPSSGGCRASFGNASLAAWCWLKIGQPPKWLVSFWLPFDTKGVPTQHPRQANSASGVRGAGSRASSQNCTGEPESSKALAFLTPSRSEPTDYQDMAEACARAREWQASGYLHDNLIECQPGRNRCHAGQRLEFGAHSIVRHSLPGRSSLCLLLVTSNADTVTAVQGDSLQPSTHLLEKVCDLVMPDDLNYSIYNTQNGRPQRT